MTERFFVLWWVVLVAAGIPLAAGAQETGGAEEVDVFSEEAQVDLSQIDQILRGEQEVIQGDFFTYDPAGRRDPFRSLLESQAQEDDISDAPRPPGLPGMLIEEIEVQGIIETPDGILAFVRGKDNISYIIRRGTALYNGEVREILPGRVVFRQQVNDPKQVQPYQDVVREIAD
jgi:Tfp pilus assembly protein PilP